MNITQGKDQAEKDLSSMVLEYSHPEATRIDTGIVRVRIPLKLKKQS